MHFIYTCANFRLVVVDVAAAANAANEQDEDGKAAAGVRNRSDASDKYQLFAPANFGAPGAAAEVPSALSLLVCITGCWNSQGYQWWR